MSLSTHQGSCHCGAVKFKVELDLDQPALMCNCSICGRTGGMLQFVSPDKFTLEQGEANLTDYQFNKKVIHHLFCKTCGVRPFARGEGPQGPMVAVNVRTLENIDVFKLPTTQYPGKDA